MLLPWPRKWREQIDYLRNLLNETRDELRAVKARIDGMDTRLVEAQINGGGAKLLVESLADAVLPPAGHNIGGSKAPLEVRRRNHRDWCEDVGITGLNLLLRRVEARADSAIYRLDGRDADEIEKAGNALAAALAGGRLRTVQPLIENWEKAKRGRDIPSPPKEE